MAVTSNLMEGFFMRDWSKRKQIMAALAAAALIVAGFLLFRPVPVGVVTPAVNVPVEVYGLGTVEARILSKVGFEVAGSLIDLAVDQGDRVAKGSLLARLNSRAQEAKLAKAEAAIMQAEANARRSQVSAEKARAVLSQKRNVSDRRQELAKKGTVSIEAAEDAGAGAIIASADLKSSASDYEIAQAALADAQAQERLERVTLANHALISPYDALIVSRSKELGAVMAPGESLFTLIDPNTVWVMAYVDEMRAGEVKLGQTAEIRLRSLPRQVFKGKVARIEVESDRANEERRIAIAWDEPPAEFHLGEQAEVTILAGVIEKGILAPESALSAIKGGTAMAWLVEEGKLTRREIKIGRRTLDGRIEIIGGIPAKGQLVSTLHPRLAEGTRAKIQ
jgi:HlyD family secretion protein